MFEAPDYRADLQEFVREYQGQKERTIQRVPEVFDFYARLYANRDVIGEPRRLVGAALAYFVVPEDVLPEEMLGPWGMLDDLYLAAHVFRLLRNDIPAESLEEAWTGEGEVALVMKEIYADAKAALGKQRKDVLRMAGVG